MTDLWIIATGCLAASSCAIVGVFLVLRRLAMLGDAISHSVLLGIVLAFLFSSSRSIPIMLLGATLVGLLTAFLTNILNQHGKLQEDASIGVTFTWLFAVGVILISAYAGQIDLDQECVLYGELAFTPLDTISIGAIDIGPRSFWTLLVVLVICCVTILFGYRSLKVSCFDKILAASLGISVTFWHYCLMTLVSLTTVASFEAVGAILVVALLVIPANTAYLFAKSLPMMLLLAVVFANFSTIGGYYLAVYFDASIAASIAMVSGFLLFASAIGLNLSSKSQLAVQPT